MRSLAQQIRALNSPRYADLEGGPSAADLIDQPSSYPLHPNVADSIVLPEDFGLDADANDDKPF